MRPTFLVIGGQRCATTWLHEVLREHPEIFVPEDKEPDFWNRRILQNCTFRDYGALFEPARRLGKPFRGCLSVNYSTLERPVVDRIAQLLPELRLAFTMRHPVDRAWSQAKLVFGIMKQRRFDRVPLARFLRFFEARRCEIRNDYLFTIDNWAGAFGPDSLHLDLYDRVLANPRGYLADIIEHLGADPSWRAPERLIRKSVHASQEMDMPEVVRWYLSSKWLEPTQRLNERLGGQVSHWVDDLRAHAAPRKPSWRLLRFLNRHLLTVPERVAYAGYSVQRQRRLINCYDEFLRNPAQSLRELDGQLVESMLPKRPRIPTGVDDPVAAKEALRLED